MCRYLLIILTVFFSSFPCGAAAPGKEEKIVENVPYICQQGWLDCGYASNAMLIGHFLKNYDTLTYSKLIYESALGYGFIYSPDSLVTLPFTGFLVLDETFNWLASLYGLSFQRTPPPEGLNAGDAWKEYLDRIWNSLQKGIPLQTFRSWTTREAPDGRMYTDDGLRPFWWEGVSGGHRPDKHSLVVVGLDRANGLIYITSPGCGWFGAGKYEAMTLAKFRQITEPLYPRVRYATRSFAPNGSPEVPEQQKKELVRLRIAKKIAGDPEVYDKIDKPCIYGLKGIEALRNDLEPDKFSGILKAKAQKEKMEPKETVAYFNMAFYQYAYDTRITSSYLETAGDVEGYAKAAALHIIYEKLCVLNNRLLAVFKAEPDFDKAMERSGPVLEEMRKTLSELEASFGEYLTPPTPAPLS